MSYSEEFIPEIEQMIWDGEIGYRAFRFDLQVVLDQLYSKGHEYSLELESICWEYIYKLTAMILDIDKNPSMTDTEKAQTVLLLADWIEQQVYREAAQIRLNPGKAGLLSLIPERVRH